MLLRQRGTLPGRGRTAKTVALARHGAGATDDLCRRTWTDDAFYPRRHSRRDGGERRLADLRLVPRRIMAASLWRAFHPGRPEWRADHRSRVPGPADSAVFFGFTHCPEVCPTTLFELDGWLKKLGHEAKDIQAYFITIDPERDTPEVMNAYLSNFSSRITGITGTPDKVWAMAKALRHLFHEGRARMAATTRWTTPPRSCCSTARANSPARSPMAKAPIAATRQAEKAGGRRVRLKRP